MNRDELLQYLEFEYWGYCEAGKRDAEQHNIPHNPLTFEEYCLERGVELEKDNKE